MKYASKSVHPPNLCIECGTEIHRPKRFCDDACKNLWLHGKGYSVDEIQQARVAQERQRRGIAPEALEWRRKLSVSRTL